MKWFDPPKTLDALKKRGQIFLLMLNIIIATTNLFLLSTRLDRLGMKTVYYCQMETPITSICLEQ